MKEFDHGIRCELFIEKLRFIARLQPRETHLFPMLDSIIFQDANTTMDAVIECHKDKSDEQA